MSFDEHARRCPRCSQPFRLCRAGRRLLVEDVDALERQVTRPIAKGIA